MRTDVDVSLGAAGHPHEVLLKLQGGGGWQLNVWATFEDLAQLGAIRSAVWVGRTSIAAGTSVGGRVFWAGPGGTDDDQTATILIGEDDEGWDIAFSVPVNVVEKIGRQAEARQLDADLPAS